MIVGVKRWLIFKKSIFWIFWDTFLELLHRKYYWGPNFEVKNRFFVFYVKVPFQPFRRRNNLTKLRIFIYNSWGQKITHFEKIDFFDFLRPLPWAFTQEMLLRAKFWGQKSIFCLLCKSTVPALREAKEPSKVTYFHL